MAKRHERVFALVAAVVFLATSVAFSAAVIWQIRSDSKNKDQATTSQSEADTQTQCQFDTPTAAKEQVPEAYKPSGDVTKLETTDLVVGSGAEVKTGDCLVVKYLGTLIDGTKFDGNFDQEKGLKFSVGTGSVIPGWDQGLVGMKVGGVRRLVIPSDLAYKEQGSGSIPPNADLVFVVKLLEIVQ